MTDDDLTLVALRVLEHAVARASTAPIVPDDGIRLALAWLNRLGLMKISICRHFWELLSLDDPLRPRLARTERRGNLESHIGHCFHQLGWQWLTAEERRMCNRYRRSDRDTIGRLFEAAQLREVNEGPAIVHPRDQAWVVRLHDGRRIMEQMTWGFPLVLKGRNGQPLAPKPVNNARFDKLLSPFWHHWFQTPAQRCLIPVRAYAEAVGEPGRKTTTWLSLKGSTDFAWAGLWRPSAEWGEVYTGVMTNAAPELRAIHDRAPVILAREDWATWLEAPQKALHVFDRPWPAGDVNVDATDRPWKDGGQAYPIDDLKNL